MEKTKSGFIHSVKVPRLYKTAAKIVQEVAEGGGSVKQLVFQQKHNVNGLYALVTMTLKKVHEINFLFKRSQILQKETRLNPWLARILVTELIWGKKKLPQNGCKPIQTVGGYEQVFRSHLSDNTGLLAEETPDNTNGKKPRYVRINILLISFNEALDHFIQEGWILHEDFNKNDYKEFLKNVENLDGDYFMIDIHVENLLIFPRGTKFFDHFGYKQGWIVLQDKASCLPVHILNPPPGSVVLDMCAAPGMKTTQLASVLNNEGQIYAVERDERRYGSLVKMVESSGATNIKTLNKDVLTCSPEDFSDVDYILVDPSCSGSGMTDRIQFQEEQSNARLERLSGFQIKILRSAITKYPNTKRVVYSTCSINAEENEDVVRQVLETNYLFKLVDARTIIKKNWLNFGSSDFGQLGEFCLYAKPEQDLTNGFFVAVFERLQEGEKNQFFDTKLFNQKKRQEEKNKRREARFLERQKEFEKLYGPVIDRTEMNNDDQEENFKNNNSESKNALDNMQPTNDVHITPKNSKKKKRKHELADEGSDHVQEIYNTNDNENLDSVKKKKKQKKNNIENWSDETQIEASEYTTSENKIHNGNEKVPESPKKKKKHKNDHNKNVLDTENQIYKKSKKEKKCKIKDLEPNSQVSVNLDKEKVKPKHGVVETFIMDIRKDILQYEDESVNLPVKKSKKPKKHKTIDLDHEMLEPITDVKSGILQYEEEPNLIKKKTKKKRQKKSDTSE